jgi:hypothetical protein
MRELPTVASAHIAGGYRICGADAYPYLGTVGSELMGDVVNLRNARKRAKKRDAEARANANRVVHGRPKSETTLTAARRDKAERELDAHRLEGDGE